MSTLSTWNNEQPHGSLRARQENLLLTAFQRLQVLDLPAFSNFQSKPQTGHGASKSKKTLKHIDAMHYHLHTLATSVPSKYHSLTSLPSWHLSASCLSSSGSLRCELHLELVKPARPTLQSAFNPPDALVAPIWPKKSPCPSRQIKHMPPAMYVALANATTQYVIWFCLHWSAWCPSGNRKIVQLLEVEIVYQYLSLNQGPNIPKHICNTVQIAIHSLQHSPCL